MAFAAAPARGDFAGSRRRGYESGLHEHTITDYRAFPTNSQHWTVVKNTQQVRVGERLAERAVTERGKKCAGGTGLRRGKNIEAGLLTSTYSWGCGRARCPAIVSRLPWGARRRAARLRVRRRPCRRCVCWRRC